jgi:1,4-dihydroxy-2-naphthoate octaprenyltransferase
LSDKTTPESNEHGNSAAPGNRLLLFLRAARAPFLTVSVMPVLIGSTLPFWLRPDGWTFSVGRLVEAVVAVALLHAGANLGNGYYDHVSGADPANPNPGVLSGGSGLIASGALPAGLFLRSSIVCLALGALLGLHLNFTTDGNLILVVGIIGVALAHFYTAPPVKLAYRGLGELAVFFAFGVLPVMGAYYVQTATVSWRVFLASLPISFAAVMVLWVNQIVDYKPDRETGKRNLAVAMGPKAAGRGMVLALALLMFGSLFAAVFTASLIPLTLVAVLAFGLIRTVVADCWSHYGRPDDLAEAASSAIRLHLTLGIIIAASALAAFGS